MKTQLLLITMTLGLLLTACGVEIGANTPAPVPPPPEEKPAPFPAKCTIYAGQFMMNSDQIEIQQKGCEEIVWTLKATPWNSAVTATYIPDGLKRTIQGRSVRATIDQETLWLKYEDSTKTSVLEHFSFQARPCNLMNPTGEMYLTKETYVAGHYRDDLCKFWSRSN